MRATITQKNCRWVDQTIQPPKNAIRSWDWESQPVLLPFLQCRDNLKTVAPFRIFHCTGLCFMQAISGNFNSFKRHTDAKISSLARPMGLCFGRTKIRLAFSRDSKRKRKKRRQVLCANKYAPQILSDPAMLWFSLVAAINQLPCGMTGASMEFCSQHVFMSAVGNIRSRRSRRPAVGVVRTSTGVVGVTILHNLELVGCAAR